MVCIPKWTCLRQLKRMASHHGHQALGSSFFGTAVHPRNELIHMPKSFFLKRYSKS